MKLKYLHVSWNICELVWKMFDIRYIHLIIVHYMFVWYDKLDILDIFFLKVL